MAKSKTEEAAQQVATAYASSGDLRALMRGVYDNGIWLGRYCNTHTREKFFTQLMDELKKGGCL